MVCGFAAVYFLGAKGFCTYGCPYGGFFAPIDEFSPGRIRVTDACEHCGHCTAVCTSNVRVHEEVREYGMVVDPGCMKCLDCVSVCPNDALYFGFGKPSVMKGEAARAAPKHRFDLTMGEEIGMAAVFALAFLAVRGDVFRFPLLMAAGTAGVTTFAVWMFWRVLRSPSVHLYRHRLKFKGSVRPAGVVFLAATAAVILLTLQNGTANLAYAGADWFDGRVTITAAEALSADASPPRCCDKTARDARRPPVSTGVIHWRRRDQSAKVIAAADRRSARVALHVHG